MGRTHRDAAAKTRAKKRPVRRRPARRKSRVEKSLAARVARLLAGDPGTPPVPGIKPSYWAYLRACIHLIDAGKSCTQINLAHELHISPQAVWKYLRRHPGVLGFVAEELRNQNKHFLPPLVRRHFFLGMQGSVASADFVAKVEGGYYLRAAGGANADETQDPGVTNINILIPRPDMPHGGTLPKASMALIAQPVSVLPAAPAIPRVEVRS